MRLNYLSLVTLIPVAVASQPARTASLRCFLLLCLVWMAQFSTLVLAATGAEEYSIGVLAHRGKESAVATWQPTINYLSQSVPGGTFRMLPLLLDEVEEAVNQRRVDFVLTNPENYIVLEARHQVTRNATLMLSHKGRSLKEFGGLIFTRADRKDIRTIKDIKGKKLAGAARNAFGAFQMQAYELLQHDIAPDDFTPVFAGLPQDKVVDAVLAGEADAGFVRTGLLESMAAAGKIKLEDFHGIGLKTKPNFPFLLSTALYPEWAFATLPHVDEQLANRVTIALLSLPQGGEVATQGGYHGWAVPLAYNTVHDLMKALRAPPYDTVEAFSLSDIVSKYQRHIMVGLLGILAVLGYFIQRFARLNASLGEQVQLVAQRSSSLAAEVQTRQQAERVLADENHVLELLAQETPIGRILDAIVAKCESRYLASRAAAILLLENGQLRLECARGLSDAQQAALDRVPAHTADAATLARLVAHEDSSCFCESIRNAQGETLGQLVLLGAPTEATPDALRVLAMLAGMAIERTQINERMRLASSVFQNALEGIVVTDPVGRIIDVSPSFTHLTGYGREEAVGQSMSLLRSGRHDPQFYRDMWNNLFERGHWSGEIWNRTRDGRIVAEMLQISSVKDRNGVISNYVGTFTDITSLKDAQSHLEKLASFDALTGLPNRGLLADRLDQALSQAQRRDRLLAICFLDLDGFKAVNDTLGHEAGDALLREVAQRLVATVRSGDTVARLGGDEFVLLLADVKDVDELEIALQRVLTTVSDPYDLAGRAAHVSTSMGVTLYPFDDGDPDTLLRHADQAMYRAKQDGRNRYHMFDTDYAMAHQERIEQRDRLRSAVEQGELVLYYQPLVDLRHHGVTGVEALVRWRHPEKGLMAPGAFLPDVEHDDLICAIGAWVLREALTQQRRWREAGTELVVSINVAARQFLDPRFIPVLESLLAEFPDRLPGGVELEILESAAIEDTTRMAKVIAHCHQLGVSFALDDFGTGYSSLTYLQRLPADTLKIDRSFVKGMLSSRSGLAIVEAIVGLANAFQCELVAEGIETLEQGELLARMGVGSGQGYVIARPMPAAEVLPWIAAYRHPEPWAYWSESALGTPDFPLVLAEFEHRCWVRDLTGATEGRSLETHPEAIHDPSRCEFGRWLEARGRVRYGNLPQFAAVDEIHRAIHILGTRIHQALMREDAAAARREIPELQQMSEKLIAVLGSLQRSAPGQAADNPA